MSDSIYRYNSFTLSRVINDMGFHGGVVPGGYIDLIDLPTTEHQRFQWPRVNSPKLLLLVFGSRTCPATISTIPDLKELYSKYGDEVEFAYLYVREAHPGNLIFQPETMGEKTMHACALQSDYQIPWKIAVDTLNGEIHHALATRPNAVYLIDETGQVIFRTLFAADSAALDKTIKEFLAGKSISQRERRLIIYPVLKLIGVTWEVVGPAGNSALRDLLLRTPFIYFPSRAAAMLKHATPFVRGSTGMALSLALFTCASWFAFNWVWSGV